MIPKSLMKAGIAAAAAFSIISGQSCINIDNKLGENLVPLGDQFDLYTAEFDLEDIQLRMVDSLSGFSNTRITIGAVRDSEFGLSTRAAAVTLVPISDTLDFGKNPVFKRFHFTSARDTSSMADNGEDRILQNINVYELEEPLDFTLSDLNYQFKHGDKRVTKGIPVYNGRDSLSFDFNRAFGEKYMSITQDDLKDMKTYLSKFPGIYISTDEPSGEGGRINMFQLQLGINTSQGYLTKDYAKLSFSGEYDGVRKDTSFFFFFCPDSKYDLDSLAYNKSQSSTYAFPQYCFNSVTHESASKAGKAGDKILVEGAAGLKPVVTAEEIVTKIREEISKHGDPKSAVINKATLVLPFEFPEDYKLMYQYPQYLSPTIRLSSPELVTYASIANSASDSDDDQGKINRSNLHYSPDITFHVQSILRLTENAKLSNYDIWFLPMSTEVSREEATSNNNSMLDYYNALSYMSYMNGMYGGYGGYGGYGYGGYGYGGYGGYGYDSYGYNNYLSYYLMSMYASQGSTSSSSTSSASLDKDRYFKAVLNGPQVKNGRSPKLKIVYAVPKEVK